MRTRRHDRKDSAIVMNHVAVLEATRVETGSARKQRAAAGAPVAADHWPNPLPIHVEAMQAATAFLLTDLNWKPIYTNDAAVLILNYPDEARRQQLHGQLVLTVSVNRDGSVRSADIIQSSGHKLLDDAALRIVKLAAPFPPIPPGEKVDELYVTRTWQFLPGDILRNR